MATCIGQKITMTLEITQEKGGSEETRTVTIPVPYSMDGVAINLPGYLAGLPEEAYLSEFQIQVEETEAETEEGVGDEIPVEGFDLGDI